MKKVLKAIALFLALTFVVLCAASCGNKEAATQGEEEIMTEKPAVQYEKVTVKEQVLVDESEVRITLKSLDFDNMDPTIKLFVENKSKYTIDLNGQVVVNGVFFDHGLNSIDSDWWILESGKSGEYRSSLYGLDSAGITTIKDFSIQFCVQIVETLSDGGHIQSGNLFETAFVHVDTSADPSFVQKYNDNGDVVYDKDGVKIVIQGKYENIDNYLGRNVYIENLSEKDIETKFSKVVINEKPYTSCEWGVGDLPAGLRGYSHICDVEFLDAFAENEVLKTISFVIDVIDSETQTVLGSSTEYTATF